MKISKLLISTLAVASLAACSSKNNSNPPSTASLAATDGPAIVGAEATTYSHGIMMREFSIARGTMMVDGVAVDPIDTSTLGDYSSLSSRADALLAMTRVIETRERFVELWDANGLAMAIDLHQDSPMITYTRIEGFHADRVAYMIDAEEQAQGLAKGTLSFDLSQCLVAEQNQDQGKVVDQDKAEAPADQDQAKDKAEAPAKAEEEKAPVCRTIKLNFNLTEIAQPKEQDQGKAQDQDKPADQGKAEAPADQGKAEAPKEQEKPVGQDKAEAPAQDQGKDKPIDQGTAPDHGKGEATDQGKK